MTTGIPQSHIAPQAQYGHVWVAPTMTTSRDAQQQQQQQVQTQVPLSSPFWQAQPQPQVVPAYFNNQVSFQGQPQNRAPDGSLTHMNQVGSGTPVYVYYIPSQYPNSIPQVQQLPLHMIPQGRHKQRNSKSKKPMLYDTEGRLICNFYRRYGQCKFGQKCKFSHQTDILNPVENQVCRFYQQSGTCKFGDSCIFSHTSKTPSEKILDEDVDDSMIDDDDPEQKNQHRASSKKAKDIVCPYWATQTCHYGSKCQWKHPPLEGLG